LHGKEHKMNKHGLFSLGGLVLALGLLSPPRTQALRVAADPLPHADILGEVKRQDPSLICR
jgi:D-methionine transport system substrate-binding protein